MFAAAFFDELEKLATNILTNSVDVVKKRWKEDVEKPRPPVVKTAMLNPVTSALMKNSTPAQAYRGIRSGVKALGGGTSRIGGVSAPKPATFKL
jgi:hypothetical protein